jgi:agmatine deiminase
MRSPADLGFSLPPEWAPHAATWTSWPFDDALWEGQLDGVRDDMAGLVALIARYEPVVVNVRDDEAEADARRRLQALGAPFGRIAFHHVPLNDAWFRDNGPIFVTDGSGHVALTDWRFNAWGRKYAPWDDDDRAPQAVAARLGMRRFEVPVVMEGGSLEVNGEGLCLTTRSCLLSRERNPGLTEHDLEELLRNTLGVQRIVWLQGSLEGDHTDGHIDTLVRFTDDRTLVCAYEADPADPNHVPTRHNLEALRALRDPRGAPYRVVPLPLPRRRMELSGSRLPPSYANFYIGNGFVAVPLYDDDNDAGALATLRPLFAEREVTGLSGAHLITGGGAFHCVTQQQPAGPTMAP